MRTKAPNSQRRSSFLPLRLPPGRPISPQTFAAGLQVLTEKPAGVYTEPARELNQAAAKSGKIFAIMFNYRTHARFQKLKNLVASGELGELKRTNWWMPPLSVFITARSICRSGLSSSQAWRRRFRRAPFRLRLAGAARAATARPVISRWLWVMAKARASASWSVGGISRKPRSTRTIS